jgi:hypothetical protein
MDVGISEERSAQRIVVRAGHALLGEGIRSRLTGVGRTTCDRDQEQ